MSTDYNLQNKDNNKIAAKTKETLQSAKSLKVSAWMHAKVGASGDHQSRFRGGGIEFSEVREYVLGDDARRIDWNVSARYDDLYVKEFTEEMDYGVYVMLDCSESMAFGAKRSKRDIANEIAASLIMSSTRDNNSTGLCIFAQTLEEFIPAKKGKAHATKLVYEIIRHQYENNTKNTNLAESLRRVSFAVKRKSVIFVISDYTSDSFARDLRLLSADHIVIIIHVSDAYEQSIPNIGYAYFEDAETGEQILVDTSKEEFQKKYAYISHKATKAIKNEAHTGGAKYIHITDRESFDVTLNRHAMANISHRYSKKTSRDRPQKPSKKEMLSDAI